MPKIIRKDGKLARLGRKFVLDTDGAPCCCGTTLFWRLTPCECTGGGTDYWTKGYAPSMGCVWANIAGECYWICPDSPSKPTLDPIDIEVNPSLAPADSAEDACAECCGEPGGLCCDLNGTCGLTRDTPPYVVLDWQIVASEFTGQYTCHSFNGSCAVRSISKHPQSNVSGSVTFANFDFPCIDETSDQKALSEPDTNPCNGTDTTYTSISSVGAAYSLFGSQTIDAPRPIGFSNKQEACIGTTANVPEPWLYAEWRQAATVGPAQRAMNYRAAISLSDPSKWWLWAEGEHYASGFLSSGSMTLTGSVSTPGSCVGRLVAAFNVVQVANWGPNSPWCETPVSFVNTHAGTFTADFSGIGPCSGSRPGGTMDEAPAGRLAPDLSLADPAVRAMLEKQSRGGGCVGCGH